MARRAKPKNSHISASIRSSVGPTAIKTAKVEHIEITSKTNPANDKKLYSRKSKKRLLKFLEGYDLLQYSIAVRPYIFRKYRIDNLLHFEAVLYMFPIQFFTLLDFQKMPLRSSNVYLKHLVEEGLVEKAVIGEKTNIYTLTKRSVDMVRDYYHYLSGKRTLNPDHYTNPFRGKDAFKADREREKLMMDLKKKEISDPNGFKRGLYD